MGSWPRVRAPSTLDSAQKPVQTSEVVYELHAAGRQGRFNHQRLENIPMWEPPNAVHEELAEACWRPENPSYYMQLTQMEKLARLVQIGSYLFGLGTGRCPELFNTFLDLQHCDKGLYPLEQKWGATPNRYRATNKGGTADNLSLIHI